MESDAPSRRIPWVALCLSFLSAGVGHLYCGHVAKGLVIYFAWFLVPLLCVIGALLPASSATLLLLIIVPTLAVFAIYIYAAIDARRLAKRIGVDYKFKDYNRAGIYCMLILVWLAYPIAMTASVRAFVYEAFFIPEHSMVPSVLAGDRILANKLLPKDYYPDRGDLIIFRNPTPTGGHTFIKRVVAVAGDSVKVAGTDVWINGTKLAKDRVPPEALVDIRDQVTGDVYYESNSGHRYKVGYGDGGGDPDDKVFEAVVPSRHVFVLGDNRDRSRDSRHFESIHIGDVIGFADYIFWPAETWSRFGAL